MDTVPGVTTSAQDLAETIDALAADCPFTLHWQIRPVGTSVIIGSGANTPVASFSTRKVSVLLACLALVEEGRLALDRRSTIRPEMKDGVQAGMMRNLSSGIELTLRDSLIQMMCTSDNICTQLVFEAIGSVETDPLQWVNDYCSWVGLDATMHREIFPRSAELTWSHSLESLTVTTANDQCLLLERLGRGAGSEQDAAELRLSRQLCLFAVEAMTTLFTPLLGSATDRLRVAEKNGRGIRGLSQVGLALDPAGTPVAAVAAYAEPIPTKLPSGVPGRVAAFDLFARIGVAMEQWQDGLHAGADEEHSSVAEVQVVPAVDWQQSFPELSYAVHSDRGGQFAHSDGHVHPFAGTGKVLFGLTVAELVEAHPEIRHMQVTVRSRHREGARTGTLRLLTGELSVGLEDAVNLVLSTGDAAAALALLEALENQGVDVLKCAQDLARRLGLNHTVITGTESPEASWGEGLTGTTSPSDLRILLQHLCAALRADHHGAAENQGEDDAGVGDSLLSAEVAELTLGWMRQVFEPAGLASALPGYGPHRVRQWTVSGWESAPRGAAEGASSVLITHSAQAGWVCAAVYHRPWSQSHQVRSPRDVSTAMGSLGLSAYLNTPA